MRAVLVGVYGGFGGVRGGAAEVWDCAVGWAVRDWRWGELGMFCEIKWEMCQMQRWCSAGK